MPLHLSLNTNIAEYTPSSKILFGNIQRFHEKTLLPDNIVSRLVIVLRFAICAFFN